MAMTPNAKPICFINSFKDEGLENKPDRDRLVRQRAAAYGAKDRRKPTTTWKRKRKVNDDYLLLALQPSLSPYEAARARYGVDLTQLAFVGGFGIGLDTSKLLRTYQPSASSAQWSYIDFIPSRYDQSESLAAATDCLLHQIACMAGISSNTTQTRQLYSKALGKLRRALDDPRESQRTETLCAAHFLSFFEIIHPTCTSSWLTHMGGIARLVQLRKPTLSTATDFDNALLAAHIGPALYQAFNNQDACYLEEPTWLEVCRSLRQADTSSLTHRSSVYMDMQLCAIEMPGLWRELHAAVMSSTEDLHSLLERLRASRRAHREVLHRLRHYLQSEHRSEGGEEAYRYALEGNIVNARLLCAIDVEDYPDLNAEVQDMVSEFLQLRAQGSAEYTWLASQHHSIIEGAFSKDEMIWTDLDLSRPVLEQRLALREMYIMWCKSTRADLPSRLPLEEQQQ